MASSIIYPGEMVFTDEHDVSEMCVDGFSRCYKGIFSSPGPYEGVNDIPDELLYPESEWEPRAKELEQNKANLSSLAKMLGVPVLDQEQTNYCWIFGVIGAFMLIRAMQGQKMIELSPASVGGPVTGFRNVGGYGEQGIVQLQKFGAVPTEFWGATDINSRLWTPENKAIAANYTCPEWFRLQPRNLKQLVSLLLRGVPVAVGFDWWGHLVYAVDVVFINGKLGIRIRNSWGNIPQYPDGYAVIQGNKMLFTDGTAPRMASAA
jgi:hypothetical protein